MLVAEGGTPTAAALTGESMAATRNAGAAKSAAAVRFIAEEGPPTLDGERKTLNQLSVITSARIGRASLWTVGVATHRSAALRTSPG
jgi:hypothetical protein